MSKTGLVKNEAAMVVLKNKLRPKLRRRMRKDLYEQMKTGLLRVIPRHEDGVRAMLSHDDVSDGIGLHRRRGTWRRAARWDVANDRGGRQVFDSRKRAADDKPSIAVILLGKPGAAPPSDRKD